jgi:propionyl-CoA synthetase
VGWSPRESSHINVLLVLVLGLTPALVDEAIQISSHKPASVVVFQRKQCKAELQSTSPKDYNWAELIDKVQRDGNTSVPCEEMKSTDELYLLYTSGTTGKPKGNPSTIIH